MTSCSKPGCDHKATWRNHKATRFGCDDHKLELVTPISEFPASWRTNGVERSNYVELLESEVRRLQAEVVRLTRREDTGDSAIIGELVAALRAIVKVTKGGQPIDHDAAWMVAESALAKVGS